MSENQEKKPITAEASGQNLHAKGNRHNRHRFHKGGNRPRPDGAPREEQHNGQPSAEGGSVDRAKNNNRQNERGNRPHPNARGGNDQNKNRESQPQKQNGKGGGNGQNSRNHRSNPKHKGGYRPVSEGRLYDPYEKPNKEEIALSELRAKIVMQAADGTIPTVYGQPPAKAQAPAETPVAVQAEEAGVCADAPLSPIPEAEEPLTSDCKKVEVVGIRFRSAGKTYYFDPHGLRLKRGEHAIVETTRGPEFGDVCLGNCMVNATNVVSPLRPVLRIATPDDIAKNEENRAHEKDAVAIFQKKVAEHKLEMKVIDVQYAFDGSKLLFYFSSEGRVDFRELVKDLASVFRTRIELRQIGIRDEAKMLGGIGACGRALCCATFLPDFAQVSIKMAKDQNLSLNSAKISGVCGRLMCCLRYEEDVYVDEIRKTPAYDSTVKTEDGVGTVIGSNPLAGTVRVILKDSPDTAPKQYHRDSVTVLPKERRSQQEPQRKNEK